MNEKIFLPNIFDLSDCQLCPRLCHADRTKDNPDAYGYCGAPSDVIVSLSCLHLWEEPCLVGESGAGTVFFAYCQLGCVYCQNHQISLTKNTAKRITKISSLPNFAATLNDTAPEVTGKDKLPLLAVGKKVSIPHLAEIFLGLEKKGAATIDLVTPTHYTWSIIAALRLAREKGLSIPSVWNSSGYERPEIIKAIASDIDIFLPDCKYYFAETANRYSKAPDYPEIAFSAIAEMVKQKGTPTFFPASNQLKSGVIVRHLVLPGCRHESIGLVKRLYREFGDNIILSLMNQYTPLEKAPYLSVYPELNRRLTKFEYQSVVNAAYDIGFRKAYIQTSGTATEAFIPVFDGSGV